MRRFRSRGYTLVELMSVLIILSTLVAVLVPKVSLARFRAIHSGCVQNVHNLGTALQTYANDNGGQYPSVLDALLVGQNPVMMSLPTCQSDGKGYEGSYVVSGDLQRFTLYCAGIHYTQLDEVMPGFPQFYSSGTLDPFGHS